MPRRQRRKAKKGGLFGKTPDRRKSALWAAGCAAAAVLFAILVQIPRSGVEPEAAYRLELWEPVGVLATLALYFGTTALVLWLPEQRRPAAQVAMASATALFLLTVTALPAERLPSPASLTYDEWPLAIALCVFALPVAFFGLNRELPVRLFILGAAVSFILILPDYVGLYIELTGGLHPMIGRTVVAVPESVWVYATAENAAERRASGVFVTWYALLLAATWAPMLYVLLRRRRALRDSPA